MPEFERDFILRQIRRIAQLIARIVSRAREQASYESGLEAVRAAVADGLGMDYGVLSRLDPASVALLVREGEVLRTLAWIAEQESGLTAGAGDAAGAERLRRRAIGLYAECAERYPEEAPACLEAARALRDGVEIAALDAPHRRWLDGAAS